MGTKRETRLPSSSSRIHFVSEEESQTLCGRIRTSFVVKTGLVIGLSLVIGVIVALMVVLLRKDSRNQTSVTDRSTGNDCSFSEEAKRVGLDSFLGKLRDKFQTHHPSFIALKPGVTSLEVRQIFRSYDFRPEALKNATDAGATLFKELLSNVFAKVNESKLKLRERKAIYVSRTILKVVFGWNPYEGNYYLGDWLLGPNIFCWQPICDVLSQLQMALPHFKPSSVSDIQRLLRVLQQHSESIHQYRKNLRLAVRVGMVRPLEACKAGVREFKIKFQTIALLNETGILATDAAKDLCSDEYLEDLNDETKETWSRQYNQTVKESLRRAVIEFIGKPFDKLIRYLETEYISHCVPDEVSNGLASLPLPFVHVNGLVQSDQQTTQRLPTGEKLSGRETYQKLMSVFTTLDISPQELRDLAREELDNILTQAISLAQEYTNEMNATKAVDKFRVELSSRDMFFNRKQFPANESGEHAFWRCATEQGARAFCPARWKAMQEWIEATNKAMDHLRPKMPQLFYISGAKKTIPDCKIQVSPWFHSEAVYHSYGESKFLNCNINPAQQLLPFFIDNFGPTYTEWTTTAHEQLPGHHLEVRSYIENFRSPCDDVISWLGWPNYFAGFTEGWATYAEHPLMANDTDVYSNLSDKQTLLQKYGMLKYRILAALRALADIEINYFGSSRNETIRLYDKYAWGTSTLASKDITRFQSAPGAVTSYMIGQMTVLKARKLMEQSLGSRFSLREFHYQVLRQGEIPLDYLMKYIQDLLTV